MYKGPTRKFNGRRQGRRPRKLSEFGQQLLEKQKLRKAYNLREKTLKNYFRTASGKKVHIDVVFVQLLERRLDNVLFRLGWSQTRTQAGQFISHGFVQINGKTVKVPSYQVVKSDSISIKESKKSLHPFKEMATKLEKHQIPTWLTFTHKDKTKAEVTGYPAVEHFTEPINVSSILQFYSR